MDSPRGYSLAQVAIHWTVAALVLFQLVFNRPMQEAFDDRLDGEGSEEMLGALVHAGVGITILVLAVIRVAIRFTRGVPRAHQDKHPILIWIAYLTHAALYGFIFLMPLTGAFAWFLGIEFSAELHEIGRLLIIPVIGLHVLGALAEHFVWKNDALVRMLRPQR
ncbi:MAG TPA: cytochrome b/b6 domain-containing protein [Devosia sp.]|nr:cytochrome b/b6 domain-containing protein [Devosia sp.]